MKKFVAASLSGFAFLALAACTEGDPGDPAMQQEPAMQDQQMQEPAPAPAPTQPN
ncbi:MAG: hypothetical protein ACK4F5_08205 [Aliihoeflea sp.]|jgi:hypothetical protein